MGSTLHELPVSVPLCRTLVREEDSATVFCDFASLQQKTAGTFAEEILRIPHLCYTVWPLKMPPNVFLKNA